MSFDRDGKFLAVLRGQQFGTGGSYEKYVKYVKCQNQNFLRSSFLYQGKTACSVFPDLKRNKEAMCRRFGKLTY